MDDLLPCPFCGGVAEYDNSDRGPYEWIHCTQCGAQSASVNYNTTKEGAFASAAIIWNMRVPQSET